MRGVLIAVYSLLRTGSEEAAVHVFTWASKEHENGLKLYQRRFRLDTRKKFFIGRLVDHPSSPWKLSWTQACWLAFEKHLDIYMVQLLGCPVESQELDSIILVDPFQFRIFYS